MTNNDSNLGFPTPHSHPQSLDTGSTPEAFLKRELELGTGCMTVTDHGSMNACRKVYDMAKAKGVTPILGIEAYFRDDKCPILTAKGVDPATHLKYYHITLHALDQEAYYALIRHVSKARIEYHGSELKPLFTWDDIEALGAHNITCGSGCLVGMVQRHLLTYGDVETAEAYYQRLRSAFKPGNFIVEVFPHYCTHDWVENVIVKMKDGSEYVWKMDKKIQLVGFDKSTPAVTFADMWAKDKSVRIESYHHRRKKTAFEGEIVGVEKLEGFVENECLPWTTNPNVQQACNEILIGFAKKYNDPIVVSDDSHYATPEEKIVQDIRLSQYGAWRFYGTYARQSVSDAWSYFKDNGHSRAEFDGWVENNRAWGARFKDFKLVEPISLPTKFYPSDTLEHTISLIRQQGRMDWKDKVYVERLKAELELLHRNGTIDLLPYFFLGADVCNAYASRGLLTGPGRGSAAGLLITYLLGITHVDPLKYGLSMDRFLTVDRIKSGKMPDIDQDLPNRDLLCEVHDEERLEVTLEDGSVFQIAPEAMVQTNDGPMRADRALETRAVVTSWGT